MNTLFKRFRDTEPAANESASSAKSPREALNEQWLRIRAGLGGSPAIDSMEAVYRAELRDLRSAERQACALADEIFVTMLSAPLAERVSQYVGTLRRRTAEHEALAELGDDARTHRNPVMRALVHESSRIAENCSNNVRDVVLVATLQHMVHYLIASYGTIASHAKALGYMEQAAQFAANADSDQQFDADLSRLAKSEINPQALAALETGARDTPH
jgi:ferritin-like metal-binding protein YciE